MYQLNPASLDSDNYNKLESKNILKKSNNTRTYKNKKNVNFFDNENSETKNKIDNISNLISKIHTSHPEEDEDEYNFQQQLLNSEKSMKPIDSNNNIVNNDTADNSNFIKNTINADFSNFDDSYKSNYDFLNNNNSNNISLDNHKLLSKLDYIVHLLEEQHNEKTNYITEELILYLFLGIFIIYVLDSFARASKYVR